MTAEIAYGTPFTPEGEPLPPGSRYVVADGEYQRTEVIRGKARVSRGVSARYTLEVPLDYTSTEIMDVFVKGCGASEAAYMPLRRAGAQLGRPGLTVGSPRGHVVGDLLSPGNIFHAERYQQEAVVAALEDVEKRYGLDRAIAVGHSMGGRDGAAVAEKLPEIIEGVTLVSAAGLERHNLLAMAGRIRPFASRDAGPNLNLLREEFHQLGTIAEMGWHVLSNPLRTGVDAVSISRADIRPRVLALGDKGVRVAILDMMSDLLVPNRSVEQGIGQQVDLYRMHPNPYLGHVAPQTHPLEVSWELHNINETLFPEDVLPARQFAVKAMGRSVKTHYDDSVELSLAS